VAAATGVHDGADRIQAEGPPLRLGPQAALALSLILHELSTNAIKYGALSAPEGRIAVRWDLEAGAPDVGDLLVFRWRESGGPEVTAPEHRSFGTRLIEMGLTSREGGETRLDYEPSGLSCRIAAPLAVLQADESEG